MNQLGKLKLIIGPMFSGKSTELIHTVKRYKYKNKKTYIIIKTNQLYIKTK